MAEVVRLFNKHAKYDEDLCIKELVPRVLDELKQEHDLPWRFDIGTYLEPVFNFDIRRDPFMSNSNFQRIADALKIAIYRVYPKLRVGYGSVPTLVDGTPLTMRCIEILPPGVEQPSA
ncbi:MAG: hypothetical protein IJ228_06630 [Succinivibrio sp.]|nr:hypothetical protein [Succinivibrio sp.]